MANPGMPLPATPEQPFWLARPDIEGETRIIYQTAKPHDISAHNAFSARDVLRAANGEKPLWVLSGQEALVEAIAVGVDNQAAIDGLKSMLHRREVGNDDPTLRVLDAEFALYGPRGRGMHQFGRF